MPEKPQALRTSLAVSEGWGWYPGSIRGMKMASDASRPAVVASPQTGHYTEGVGKCCTNSSGRNSFVARKMHL
jgi:hypothetical protein